MSRIANAAVLTLALTAAISVGTLTGGWLGFVLVMCGILGISWIALEWAGSQR